MYVGTDDKAPELWICTHTVSLERPTHILHNLSCDDVLSYNEVSAC